MGGELLEAFCCETDALTQATAKKCKSETMEILNKGPSKNKDLQYVGERGTYLAYSICGGVEQQENCTHR